MRSALAIALVLAARVALADTLTDYGFDPGLVVRRIATPSQPSDARYWEACPADASGCRALRAGEGFHTLAAGTLEAVIPDCAINSGGSCPWYFVWDGANAALGISALGPAQRPNANIYLGLQDNLKNAASPYRFGSFDHPAIAHAATSEILGAQFVAGSGSSRVASGIVFYADRAYVLEVNIDSVGSVPDWSATTRIAHRDCPPASASVCSIYLGARAFGIPSVVGSNHALFIDWSVLVRKLIASGDLPAVAISALVTDGWYTGQEVLGAFATGVQISNRHIYGIEHSPLGSLDALGANAAGWAFDWDAPLTALSVSIYQDGPRGSGALVATTPANLPSPDLIALGYPGAHRFRTPALAGHSYFAYATDPSTGEISLLPGSGRR